MLSSQQIAADIAGRRRAAGLSQSRLAGEAKCSRATVAMIEGGYVPQRSEVIPRIERVLDAILNDETQPRPEAASRTTSAVTATDCAGS
jgi:transcriptional regulator with XRE-family HTH domain